MDYGGNDRRKTKKDLKRKRLARGYKKGGQFRTHEVSAPKGVPSAQMVSAIADKVGKTDGEAKDKTKKGRRKKKY